MVLVKISPSINLTVWIGIVAVGLVKSEIWVVLKMCFEHNNEMKSSIKNRRFVGVSGLYYFRLWECDACEMWDDNLWGSHDHVTTSQVAKALGIRSHKKNICVKCFTSCIRSLSAIGSVSISLFIWLPSYFDGPLSYFYSCMKVMCLSLVAMCMEDCILHAHRNHPIYRRWRCWYLRIAIVNTGQRIVFSVLFCFCYALPV